MDAYHIAAAESAKSDVFLTTDDKLLKRAHNHKNELFVRIENPLSWIKEIEHQ